MLNKEPFFAAEGDAALQDCLKKERLIDCFRTKYLHKWSVYDSVYDSTAIRIFFISAQDSAYERRIYMSRLLHNLNLASVQTKLTNQLH